MAYVSLCFGESPNTPSPALVLVGGTGSTRGPHLPLVPACSMVTSLALC